MSTKSTKRLTPQQAFDNLKVSHPHLVFPTLLTLNSSIFNSKTLLPYFCNLCNLEGLTQKSYKDITRTKIGCSRCSGTGIYNKKTTERGREELIKRFPILLDPKAFDISELQIESSVKPVIGIKCLRHPNHIIKRVFNDMMSMDSHVVTPCQECNIEIRSKNLSHGKEKFIEQFGKDIARVQNLSFEAVPDNFLDKDRIPVYCLNHEEPLLFYKRPNDLKNGQFCPRCGKGKHVSKNELELIEYIRNTGAKCWTSVSMRNRQELDILLPGRAKSLGIEFNGDYYHSELFRDRDYHSDKHAYCKSIGIELIQIFENEWVHKKELIKHRLNSILGLCRKIPARRCEIRLVRFKDVASFLDKYHLQGKGNPTNIVYATFYEGELVAVMTFGKIRYEKNMNKEGQEDSYELLRYCSNYTVVGGFSKSLASFERDFHPKRVISYSDRNWGWGNVYHVNGFSHISVSKIGYFWSRNREIVKRHDSQKHKLLKRFPEFRSDPTATEDSIMKSLGYVKVWTCGSDKWEKKYKY
jgi:hypothetical protein